MQQHECHLRWNAERGEVEPGGTTDLNRALWNCCSDCAFAQPDNPYPFEQLLALRTGAVDAVTMHAQVVTYRHGIYEVIDELDPSGRTLRFPVESVIIYAKYLARCRTERRDQRFHIVAELV
ncbi:hypothetical protein SAMN03159338_1195 [Sphingomonas sp. NFR04]|uniref:hypothetical protein n=1 Tax=Sphingomonas sp. NFR04 TaxID=1566283 RepID=UPI0008EC9BB0|nr:hypothetical protein [Sphingomonas sp. NFR04]SFJ25080.1 hypothetical protein SAMN03159338_1195 [Sphingomonas sp. NFR04]